MKVGRELDALIAEKVMGLKLVDKDACECGAVRNFSLVVKPYSTDISAAWEVAEKLRMDGFKVVIQGSELDGFDCLFDCIAGARGLFYAEANTVPLAICQAALKAVG